MPLVDLPAQIQVTLRLGEPLGGAVGRRRLQIALPAPATLADLLAHLAAAHPHFAARFRGDDLGHDHPYRLFVNYTQVGEDQALADGDLVHIVIPVLGGTT